MLNVRDLIWCVEQYHEKTSDKTYVNVFLYGKGLAFKPYLIAEEKEEEQV